MKSADHTVPGARGMSRLKKQQLIAILRGIFQLRNFVSTNGEKN